MHWADVAASRLAERGKSHIIAAGITPSGEVHIGHIRELLTGEIITRACHHIGLDAEFIFIVDSADPLRKVYPFLDDSYADFIGHQIGSIPPPDKDGRPDIDVFERDGKTYAQHFLDPFLDALAQIGVKPRIVDNLTMYRSGMFEPYAKMVCEAPEIIREIIERVSGRELPDDWFPWTPLDTEGRLGDVKIVDYQHPLVHFEQKNGLRGTSDISKGEGKLPWRIDWPARWCFNNITMEPFGKDHGTAGGSYDTGRELVEFFGHSAPEALTYEWISLKGKGAMSSSVGNTIGPMEALRLVPPEILRLLIAKSKPSKAIEFDSGMGLVTLADEFERLSSRDFVQELEDESLSRRQRVQVEDAQAAMRYAAVEQGLQSTSQSVSFRHLSMVAQIRSSDEEVFQSLIDSNMIDSITPTLIDRLSRMRYWISTHHFPEEMKIQVQSNLHQQFLEHYQPEHGLIYVAMSDQLSAIEWSTDTIQSTFKEIAQQTGVVMKEIYRACYLLVLGVQKGPRIGPILEAMGQQAALQLLDLAIQHGTTKD